MTAGARSVSSNEDVGGVGERTDAGSPVGVGVRSVLANRTRLSISNGEGATSATSATSATAVISMSVVPGIAIAPPSTCWPRRNGTSRSGSSTTAPGPERPCLPSDTFKASTPRGATLAPIKHNMGCTGTRNTLATAAA